MPVTRADTHQRLLVPAALAALLVGLCAPSLFAQQKPAPTKPGSTKAAPSQQQTQEQDPAQGRTFTDKPRLREQWFYEQRAYPLKQIPPGVRMKAIERLEEMRRAERERRVGLSAEAIMASETMWTNIGPQPSNSGSGQFDFGNTSGRIGAIAVDPTNPDIVYLGGAQGGVWKTTDGGQTWMPLTDDQPSLAVGAIAVDSTSCMPGPCTTIYVGTGEQTFSSSSYYGAGILKSTNGGANWTQLPGMITNVPGIASFVGPFSGGFAPGGGARIGSLVVNPANPNVLLAGVQIFTSAAVDGGASSGIYRSTDGGVTWSNVRPGAPGTEVFFDPNNSMVAWAALGNLFGDPDNGIYRSADMGATWTRVTGTGLPTANLGRIELAIAPSNSQTLYASIADSTDASSDLLGVFRTTNGGTSWTNMNAPNFCAGQCWYDHVIRVHPNNASVVYAGGAAPSFGTGGYFVRNTNALAPSPQQADWVGVAVGGNGVRIHVDIHALAFGFNGNQAVRLYNGNDGGVWSADVSNPTGSINWNNLNAGLSLTQHYPALSFHPSTDDVTVVGSQDNDTHRYTGALAWQQVGPGCDGGWTVIDPAIPSTWFITCQGPVVFRSVQNGVPLSYSFVSIDIILGGDNSAFIPPLVVDSNLPQRLYFGTSRVWQTINSGDSWTPISPDLTGGQCDSSSSLCVRSIAVAPGDSNVVYAGTGTGRIWRTLSAGLGSNAVWEEVTRTTLPSRLVTQIALDPLNANVAYATFSGFGVCSGPVTCDGKGHVFKTADGGLTWLDISIAPFSLTPLPDTPVNDIVVDPSDPTGNTLYIGTDVGIFFTTDGGLNWATLVTGLPRVAVFSLRLRQTSRLLRAATHGRGVWDLQLPGLPAFHLRSISPTTATAGSSTDVNLVAVGAGFTASSVVEFDGMPLLPTTQDVTNPTTRLNATVPAAMLATAGVPHIRVNDPGQGITNELVFTLTTAAPTLSAVNPNTAMRGSGDTVIALTGTNFVTGSVARFADRDFNRTDLSTTFISSTQLQATIPAAQLTTGGFFFVTVFNPPPGGGESSAVTFTVTAPPPPNDNFASAIVITGTTFSDSQNTIGATTEANDPNPGSFGTCPGAGRNFSIWYRFTPTSNVTVAADTLGSEYDTVLSVWSGTALGALTPVACSDDAVFPGGPSELTVTLTAGTTYNFMITGFGSQDAGETIFTFSVAVPPPNDNFAAATAVDSTFFLDGVNSALATTETADPTPPVSCFPFGTAGLVNSGRAKSIWYRFTPASNATVDAGTIFSSYDTILSVWSGTAGNLTNVACNDDSGSVQSSVTFSAIANTTYYFMITAFAGDGGSTLFSLSSSVGPASDFSMSPSPSTVTVVRGQPGTTTVTVSSISGFSSAVTLSCSGLPTLSNCVFNPASVTPGANPANSTLTINTTAGAMAPPPPSIPLAPLAFYYLLAAIALALTVATWRLRRARRPAWVAGAALLLLLLFAALHSACGGGGGSSPPPNPGTTRGTFTVTITGTSGATTRTTTLTLTVN